MLLGWVNILLCEHLYIRFFFQTSDCNSYLGIIPSKTSAAIYTEFYWWSGRFFQMIQYIGMSSPHFFSFWLWGVGGVYIDTLLLTSIMIYCSPTSHNLNIVPSRSFKMWMLLPSNWAIFWEKFGREMSTSTLESYRLSLKNGRSFKQRYIFLSSGFFLKRE